MLRIYMKDGNNVIMLLAEEAGKNYLTKNYVLTKTGKIDRSKVVEVEKIPEWQEKGIGGK